MVLIELRSLIQPEFGVTLPLLRLFEHSTLLAMASAILSPSFPFTSTVDWAAEAGMNPLVGEFLKAAGSGEGLQIGQRLL